MEIVNCVDYVDKRGVYCEGGENGELSKKIRVFFKLSDNLPIYQNYLTIYVFIR